MQARAADSHENETGPVAALAPRADVVRMRPSPLTAEARAKAQEARRAPLHLPEDPHLRMRVLAVPPQQRRAYLKVVTDVAGLRERVRLKCLDCSGWQREEVTRCTVRACPLWAERPYQGAGGSQIPSPGQDESEEPRSDGAEVVQVGIVAE